jgi:hypothetical protein
MSSYFDLPKFNWLPRPSMWREAQDRAQRQADIKANEDLTNAIVDKLSNVAAVNISSKGNLAAQAALKRVQAATKAKQEMQQAEAAKAAADTEPSFPTAKDVTLSDGTVIKATKGITLAGGTRIDPNAGTMTLSDGTLISLLTGRKVEKVDVTT